MEGEVSLSKCCHSRLSSRCSCSCSCAMSSGTSDAMASPVGGMLMVEIFSIAKSLPLTKLFYLGKISMAKSLHIMNLSAVGDKMT